MYLGARFSPQAHPIVKFTIQGGYNASNGLPVYFSGFWPDKDTDYRMGQLATWTSSPKFRLEYDTKAEADIEAALIVEMGCRGCRPIEVRKVTL